MENKELEAPTTSEGIGIHLSYISKGMLELNKKFDAIQSNTVNRNEWLDHLKIDADHEARIRLCEAATSDLKTNISDINTTIKVWGIAIGGFFTLFELGLRFFGR